MAFGAAVNMICGINKYCNTNQMILEGSQFGAQKGYFKVKKQADGGVYIIQVDLDSSLLLGLFNYKAAQEYHSGGREEDDMRNFFIEGEFCLLDSSIPDAVMTPLALGDGVDFIKAARDVTKSTWQTALFTDEGPQELADYMWQQLDGLRKAMTWIHEKGFFFSDFKPGNIFIYPDGWKIGDLKSFSTDSESWLEGRITFIYLAPEVIEQIIRLYRGLETDCSPEVRAKQEVLNFEHVAVIILALGSLEEVNSQRAVCIDRLLNAHENETTEDEVARVGGALQKLKEINTADVGFFPNLRALAQERATVMAQGKREEQTHGAGTRLSDSVASILSQMTQGFFQMGVYSLNQDMEVSSEKYENPDSCCVA